MCKIKSQQDGQPEHDHRRQHSQLRMQQNQRHDKCLHHNDHDRYDQMYEPFMLEHSDLLPVHLQHPGASLPLRESPPDRLLIFPAVLLHIYSKFIIHDK